MSSDPKITIHGWRNDGPVFEVQTHNAGWANRRNRWQVAHSHGNRGGAYSKQPDFAPVWHDDRLGYTVYAVNRGHDYTAVVAIDGEEHNILVLAGGGYSTFKVMDEDELVDVRSHEGGWTPDEPAEQPVEQQGDGTDVTQIEGDDEDDVSSDADSGSGADEEE